jgi:hypothetical protein
LLPRIRIENPLDVMFSAFMIPMRAIIVGPPHETSNSTSMAVCHSGRADSFFGSLVMWSAAVFQGDERPAVGQRDGILKNGGLGALKPQMS